MPSTQFADWSIGILMANAQSFCSVLGLALQRYSHLLNQASPNPKPQYFQKWWILGIAMYVGCQPFTVIALAYAPVSIIAPLGSLNIVYNAVICRLLIGEQFRPRDVLATIICFSAAIGVVVFGPKPSSTEKFPADRLVHFWDYSDIFLYVVITGLALVVSTVTSFSQMLGEKKVYCWAIIVAVVTAWSQLFVKCFSHELRQGFTIERAFPILITLFGVAATAITSLVVMTRACATFENRFFVSAIAALRIVLQATQGAVFFQEWRGATTVSTVLFITCCIICIASVSFISIRNDKSGAQSKKCVQLDDLDESSLNDTVTLLKNMSEAEGRGSPAKKDN